VFVLLVWSVAAAIAIVPLVWLGSRNVRAVPIGALLVALLAVVGFGALAVGGAGAGNPSDAPKALRIWITTMFVLVALCSVNLYFLKGSLDERLNASALSFGIWIYVVVVMSVGHGQIRGLEADASNLAWRKKREAAEAEVQRLRAELNKSPERRSAVLDSAIIGFRENVAASYERVVRTVVFGDPASSPEDVVVWCVVEFRPRRTMSDFGYYGERSHYRLNELLREMGYPTKVSAGFVSLETVEAAGGDQEYFGVGGMRVVPQYKPDNAIGAVPRVIADPEIKG
jgi:hypothetical protein